MKPLSFSALEEQTSAFVTELLMGVPVARAQGTREELLALLERAILFYPVFRNWRSPVDEWLEEAEQLARDLGRRDALATVMLRRAVVRMRRLEYAAALGDLERVREARSPLSPLLVTWHTVTRARILTRQQQFGVAREELAGLVRSQADDWVAVLPIIAMGELQIETNEIELALKTLQEALTRLPRDLVEERIQVLQSLGFVAISQVNSPLAMQYLDEARQMLRGAAVWSEVIQMNLAVGGFCTAAGDQRAAQALLAEALDLCQQFPQPELEPLLHLALARSKAAAGQIDAAVNAAMGGARLYASQRNIVGYVSVIVLIANMYIEARNYAEAYRTLATGLAIARQRSWPIVDRVLRGHINQLRNERVGPERFDAMVQEMIDRLPR